MPRKSTKRKIEVTDQATAFLRELTNDNRRLRIEINELRNDIIEQIATEFRVRCQIIEHDVGEKQKQITKVDRNVESILQSDVRINSSIRELFSEVSELYVRVAVCERAVSLRPRSLWRRLFHLKRKEDTMGGK